MKQILVSLLLLFLLPAAALAHGAGTLVEQHHEKVQVGPYKVFVGFTEWPMRAERSLDILFVPYGGIADKKGTVTLIAPNGEQQTIPLSRHPRDRSVWGLDTTSLPLAGNWAFHFAIDGPQGHGEGELTGIYLLRRPGPPLWLSWSIGFLPIIALICLLILSWLRIRPGRLAEVHVW